MTFTNALEVLLAGGKVRRPTWAPSVPNLHVNEEDYVDFDSGGRSAQFALHLVSITATDWVEVGSRSTHPADDDLAFAGDQ